MDASLVIYERGRLRAGEEWVERNLVPVAAVAVAVSVLQVCNASLCCIPASSCVVPSLFCLCLHPFFLSVKVPKLHKVVFSAFMCMI